MFRNLSVDLDYQKHKQFANIGQYKISQGVARGQNSSNRVQKKSELPSILEDETSNYTVNQKSMKIPHSQMNRHFECEKDRRMHYKSADDTKTEIKLINPFMVRHSKELKQKPAMSSDDKKRLIKSFNSIQSEFFTTSPMHVEYNILRSKQQQRERDQKYQGSYYKQSVSASHFSKVLVRGWNQIISALTLQDHFTINLTDKDVANILSKQPKGLLNLVDNTKITGNLVMDDQIGFERRKQLVEGVFADKHFDASDREVLYSVMKHQIEIAIKQQERIERVGLGLKVNKKQNNNAEQLKKLAEFINDNYCHLVKQI